MPTLDRLESRLGGKDFQVIGLSIDRKGIESVKDFYREVGVEKLAIFLDPSGRDARPRHSGRADNRADRPGGS